MEKVYVLIEEWDFTDVGDSGVQIGIYADREKAIEELKKRQKEIERRREGHSSLCLDTVLSACSMN